MSKGRPDEFLPIAEAISIGAIIGSSLGWFIGYSIGNASAVIGPVIGAVVGSFILSLSYYRLSERFQTSRRKINHLADDKSENQQQRSSNTNVAEAVKSPPGIIKPFESLTGLGRSNAVMDAEVIVPSPMSVPNPRLLYDSSPEFTSEVQMEESIDIQICVDIETLRAMMISKSRSWRLSVDSNDPSISHLKEISESRTTRED